MATRVNRKVMMAHMMAMKESKRGTLVCNLEMSDCKRVTPVNMMAMLVSNLAM